ncbi:MAG: GNAT family N-acetyltransferase, partial [Pseudomonadota bacterium]
DVSRHTFERMADPDYEQMFGFLAIDGTSGAVGMVTGVFQPSTFVKEPICYLEDLFTHADARGKGVGRALISAVGEHAKQTGCPKVYWHTAENNYAGRTLYDKVAKQTHIKYEQKFKA